MSGRGRENLRELCAQSLLDLLQRLSHAHVFGIASDCSLTYLCDVGGHNFSLVCTSTFIPVKQAR